MIPLSKLGTALTVVFAVSVVAILAQLFCVLRRWRRIRRQTLFVVKNSLYNTFSAGKTSPTSPSTTLQRSSSTFSAGKINPASPSPPLYTEETMEMDNVLKWRGLYMYGPSRFLFMIVEERGGVDSENCSSS
jgi:hypothetical protein